MSKKTLLCLILLVFILCFYTDLTSAVQIETGPQEVNLITDIKNSMAEVEQQESHHITISDLTEISSLEIKFESPELIIFKELEVYICIYNSLSNSWDRWFRWDISQPLTIAFPEYLPTEIVAEILSSDSLSIKFTFMVPQTIKIREGNFAGNICLSIFEE